MRQRDSILLTHLDRADLYPIVIALNSEVDRPLRHELRSLVDSWQKSGPNLETLMRSNTQLGQRLQAAWQVKFTPTESGRAHLQLVRVPPTLTFEQAVRPFHRRPPKVGAAWLRAEKRALFL